MTDSTVSLDCEAAVGGDLQGCLVPCDPCCPDISSSVPDPAEPAEMFRAVVSELDGTFEIIRNSFAKFVVRVYRTVSAAFPALPVRFGRIVFPRAAFSLLSKTELRL